MNNSLLKSLDQYPQVTMSSIPSLNHTITLKSEIAKTTRALRRAWQKCIRSEELSRFLGDLLTEGVGVPKDEEFLISEDGRRKAGKMGEKGKAGLREKLTRGKLSDANKATKRNRRTRGKLRKRLERLLTKRQAQNTASKVLLHCSRVRDKLRSEYKNRVAWLKNKYITKPGDKEILPEELALFKDCKIFDNKSKLTPDIIKGVEIVTMGGRSLFSVRMKENC